MPVQPEQNNKSQKPILIVEDDFDLQEMMRLLLSGEGYRVTMARDGREALERVAEEMPGLILLDMKMVGMSGWEFAQKFHDLHDRAAPIVVITAADDAKKRAQEIGADDYLWKPFEIRDVIAIVEKHINKK